MGRQGSRLHVPGAETGKGKGCGNGAETGEEPGPNHREGSRPENRSSAQPYSMQDAGQT